MNKPSTENLSSLISPQKLQQLCKSIATLEAIVCPEWEYRYYSYQKDWSETEEFCEMRDGQGDYMLILFSEVGVCINGFAHESQLNGWSKVANKKISSFFDGLFGKSTSNSKLRLDVSASILENLPLQFHEFIYGEPVKSIGTTFCIWSTSDKKKWELGKLNLPNDNYKDGSSDLLKLLDGNPKTYKTWAEEYYEDEEFEEIFLKLGYVEYIYQGKELTKDLVLQINPNIESFSHLEKDLNQIGYKYNF